MYLADRSVTLTWQEALSSIRLFQPNATWILDLVWEKIRDSAGLYVIENGAGTCLYAGKATDFQVRFRNRNEPLREFKLLTDENPVEDYRVRCATLNPYMDDDDDPTLIDLTERWLIRHIYLLQDEGGTMSLQNVDKVNDYTFLSNFTVSQADNTFRPAYLTEADYEYSKGDPIKITKVGSRLPGNAVSWTNGPPEAADGASRRPDLIDHSGRELR